MKRHLLLILVVLLFSCGENTEDSELSNKNNHRSPIVYVEEEPVDPESEPLSDLSIEENQNSNELIPNLFCDKYVERHQELQEEDIRIIAPVKDEIYSSMGIILRERPSVFNDLEAENRSDIQLEYLTKVEIIEDLPWELNDGTISKKFKIRFEGQIYYLFSDDIALYFEETNTVLIKDAFHHFYDNNFITLFIVENQHLGIFKDHKITFIENDSFIDKDSFRTTYYRTLDRIDLNNDGIDELYLEKIDFGGRYFAGAICDEIIEYVDFRNGETIFSYSESNFHSGLNLDEGRIEKYDLDGDLFIETILYIYQKSDCFPERNNTSMMYNSTLFQWNGVVYEPYLETPLLNMLFQVDLKVLDHYEENANVVLEIAKETQVTIQYFIISHNALWVYIRTEDGEGWIPGIDIGFGL